MIVNSIAGFLESLIGFHFQEENYVWVRFLCHLLLYLVAIQRKMYEYLK